MYIDLLLITLIPIVVTLVLYLIKVKTKFYDLPFWTRQIIIGVIYGLIAVYGNEKGVLVNGANANVRDAAPILAGLVFGGPAGIIAGAIGGIERFLAVYWHNNLWLTRWACSISTVLAGVFAALLRKFMFEDKRPSWGFALAIAIVIEVFHFTMVFVTNMNDPLTIMVIIKKLALPMIVANGVGVAVPVAIIQFATRKNEIRIEDKKRVSNQVKWWLLGTIISCYLVSTTIVYSVQTNSAYSTADNTFSLTIDDVKQNVVEHSDTYMEEVLNRVMEAYYNDPYNSELSKIENRNELNSLRQRYNNLCTTLGVFSIDIIKKDDAGKGIFVCSSDLNFNIYWDDPSQEEPFYMTQYPGQSFELHTAMTNGKNTQFIQDFRPRSDTENGGIIYLKYAAKEIDNNYYLITSISEKQFHTVIKEKVTEITSHRHVNTNGHILILEREIPDTYDENTVFSYVPISDETAYNGKSSGLDGNYLIANVKTNTRVQGRVYEEDCFYMYTSAETFLIIVILPYDDVLSDRDSSFMLNSFMQVLTYATLYIIIYALLQKLVVRKIEVINHDLGKIIEGNLEVKVDVKSCLEFTKLSNDINFTVDTLKDYISEAEKRIDDELSFAKTIQLSALPSTFPAFPDKKQFDIFATMNTAKEVGGDFYDFYIIDNEHLAFLIADVSGKGIPAAMFMMESKAMLKNLAKSILSADEVISGANDGLAQNNDANMFVTCWFGILNFKTGHVQFANAGHNNPLIYRKGGKWEYISQKRNMPLGAMGGLPYCLQEFDLKPGDRIYLYTDGATEANNLQGALYGESRLEKYLNEHKKDGLQETLYGVKGDIDKFAEGADQFDDITMLILEYKGE